MFVNIILFLTVGHKSIKIVLQWRNSGESPISDVTIKGASAIDLLAGAAAAGGMTVPLQRGSMAMLQPPRSRFMINDILGGGGGGGGGAGGIVGGGVGGLVNGLENDRRSTSPQGPRDLSVPPNSRHLHHIQQHHHHHHHHMQQQQHDDSDSDSSGQLDDQSVCSNGKRMIDIYFILLDFYFSFIFNC